MWLPISWHSYVIFQNSTTSYIVRCNPPHTFSNNFPVFQNTLKTPEAYRMAWLFFIPVSWKWMQRLIRFRANQAATDVSTARRWKGPVLCRMSTSPTWRSRIAEEIRRHGPLDPSSILIVTISYRGGPRFVSFYALFRRPCSNLINSEDTIYNRWA